MTLWDVRDMFIWQAGPNVWVRWIESGPFLNIGVRGEGLARFTITRNKDTFTISSTALEDRVFADDRARSYFRGMIHTLVLG